MGRVAVGGRVEPKVGLDASPLSREPRLKDASFLIGMNCAAKETPTAEPIFGELSATIAVIKDPPQDHGHSGSCVGLPEFINAVSPVRNEKRIHFCMPVHI